MRFQKEADNLYSKLEIEEEDGELNFYRKRKVYPILNRDGTINWFNFLTGGSWIKLFILIILVGIILGAIFEVRHFIDLANKCITNSVQLNFTKPNPFLR